MSKYEEITFLHDIASPVGTAMFLLDILLDSLKSKSELDFEELAQIQQLVEVMEKMKGLIEKRRQSIL